ncbi:hypothetical protein QAD02_019822 [Eretmocerus hayati]|uniref:Uncharacterized protein n=1 Tax=Eretmocerus hayati TaxID=131215 RepID=A0ACC2PQH6_9HYME|nr:hypothetical protein QAD02_019822 [Eretmocerus hayati]
MPTQSIMERPAKKRKTGYNPKEESRLEKLVFGDPSDVIENLKNDKGESGTDNESEFEQEPEAAPQCSNRDALVQIDSVGEDHDSDDDEFFDTDPSRKVDQRNDGQAPAWKDEDDEDLSVKEALSAQNRKLPGKRPEKKYKELLQNKFLHVMGTPKWAKLDREEREESCDSDEEILRHSNHLIPKKSKSLSKGVIDLKVLSHVNKKTHTEGPFVNTVQFHRSSTVALVAGSSGVLSLFEIDGRENNKLTSIHFERFPIHTARFLRDDTEVLVGSMSHAFCHSYDLMTGKTQRILLPHGITNMKKFEISPDGKLIAICGRLGDIHLLSSTTKELIGSMKMNKKCRSLAFTPDSSKLLSHGDPSAENQESLCSDENSREDKPITTNINKRPLSTSASETSTREVADDTVEKSVVVSRVTKTVKKARIGEPEDFELVVSKKPPAAADYFKDNLDASPSLIPTDSLASYKSNCKIRTVDDITEQGCRTGQYYFEHYFSDPAKP